ncbi:MAG: (Fe-S)-binding protein [Deltaproteobacteria bacterium]|jgi:Fe-S oxidoreductase|nr:(Fe-S)-binding protein [Deltaproteobacteria bacterium]
MIENNKQIDASDQPGKPPGSEVIAPDRQMGCLRRAVEDNLSRKIQAMLNSCVNCGLCAESCHYYCSTGDSEVIPANKAAKLARVLDTHFHPVKARLPFFRPAEQLDEQTIAALHKAAYEDCTLCAKCALTCPMGINTGEILSLARAMLCSIGHLPSGLVHPVETAFEVGNYLGLTTEDFVENIEWIAEELADEIEDESFTIPIDKPNAELLYIPHPLEARDLPFLLMYALKILHAAGEDYTVSSYDFDTVNYAYYQGSKANMMRIAQRVLDAREKLQAKSIGLAPCGHGYRVLRWEVEKYLGKRLDFPPVKSIVELIEGYLRQGRIRVEKDKFEGPITYHDPCNIARRGGIIEAPRNVLNAVTSNLVEMHPNRARNFCCGGGGGLASSGDFGKIRVTAGRKKAEQIRETGARIVATNCFNCMTQIRDLSKEYDLGIEVKSIVELVSESLIMQAGS